MDLISVIIPVYNVSKYLERCLDTVIKQSYSNLEIILINDGSTDNSLEICQRYEKIDNRIKLFSKLNGGLSDARNYGLKYINGKYVVFIDSDDFIENDMIEYLYSLLKKYDADISSCAFKPTNGEDIDIEDKCEEIKCMNSQEALKEMINKKIFFRTAAWNKLYKRELFEVIRYPKGKIYEDMTTTAELLAKANKIVYSNKVKYHYLKRNNSITSSKFTSKEYDRVSMSKELLEFIEENFEKLTNYYKVYHCTNINAVVNKMILSNQVDLYKVLEYQKYIRKNKEVILISYLPLIKKIQLILFCMNFKIYSNIYLKNYKKA